MEEEVGVCECHHRMNVRYVTRNIFFVIVSVVVVVVVVHYLGFQEFSFEFVHVVDVLQTVVSAHWQQLGEQGTKHEDRDHDGEGARGAQTEGIASGQTGRIAA